VTYNGFLLGDTGGFHDLTVIFVGLSKCFGKIG
jgi:hypothetical protein